MFLQLRLRRHMHMQHIEQISLQYLLVARSDFNWSCWAAKQILMQSATQDKLVLLSSENQINMELNFLLASHKRALVRSFPSCLLVIGQNLDRLQRLQCQHVNMLQCTSHFSVRRSKQPNCTEDELPTTLTLEN
jgi:hypothetical protein